jgi:hypothetical protein
MSASIFILWMTLFSSSGPSSPVRRFTPVPIGRFPRAIFQRDFCKEQTSELEQCWASFRDQGGVWAANIDESHEDALLVNPSGVDWHGAQGEWYFLYRKHGKDWTVENISRGEDTRMAGRRGILDSMSYPSYETDITISALSSMAVSNGMARNMFGTSRRTMINFLQSGLTPRTTTKPRFSGQSATLA